MIIYNNNFNEEMKKELKELNSTTKENINNILLNTLGMSYDEFDDIIYCKPIALV